MAKIKKDSLFDKCLHNKSIVIAVVILLFFLVIGILAPVIASHDPEALDVRHKLEGPCAEYPFGCDQLGRCILCRMIWGTRVTLPYSIYTLIVALVLGVPIGLAAGYFNKLDNPLMRLVDICLAFPGMLLAIVIVAILGAGIRNVTIAVGIGTMPAIARLVRSRVLSLKKATFVEASISNGAGHFRILVRHILPNCMPDLITFSMVQMAWIISSISTMSFLGIGAQAPTAEWGALVSDGRDYLISSPHVASFPVIFIFLAVTAFNLLGDGLRDELDPRLNGRR